MDARTVLDRAGGVFLQERRERRHAGAARDQRHLRSRGRADHELPVRQLDPDLAARAQLFLHPRGEPPLHGIDDLHFVLAARGARDGEDP